MVFGEVFFIPIHRATKKEVNDFLTDVRAAIDINAWDFLERKNTKRVLTSFGLTEQDAIDVIYELTFDDYYMGPKKNEYPDRDDVWEFKVIFEYRIFYIKLEIEYRNNKDLLVWSFHPDGENW